VIDLSVVQKAGTIVGTGVEIGVYAVSTPVMVITIEINCAVAIGGSSSSPYARTERAPCYVNPDAECELGRLGQTRVDRYV